MIPAYCITCSETDRGPKAEAHFAAVGLPVTFVRGVHGRTWGLQTEKEADPQTHWRMSPGHVGLNLSHWFLWQHLWLCGVEAALVLEDDAHFAADFPERFGEAFAALPDDWQFAFVGWIDRPEVRRQAINAHVCRWEGRHPFGTHAYAVRRSALPVLLETMREARTHVDLQLAENALPKLRVYVFASSLAGQHSYEGTWPRLVVG